MKHQLQQLCVGLFFVLVMVSDVGAVWPQPRMEDPRFDGPKSHEYSPYSTKAGAKSPKSSQTISSIPPGKPHKAEKSSSQPPVEVFDPVISKLDQNSFNPLSGQSHPQTISQTAASLEELDTGSMYTDRLSVEKQPLRPRPVDKAAVKVHSKPSKQPQVTLLENFNLDLDLAPKAKKAVKLPKDKVAYSSKQPNPYGPTPEPIKFQRAGQAEADTTQQQATKKTGGPTAVKLARHHSKTLMLVNRRRSLLAFRPRKLNSKARLAAKSIETLEHKSELKSEPAIEETATTVGFSQKGVIAMAEVEDHDLQAEDESSLQLKSKDARSSARHLAQVAESARLYSKSQGPALPVTPQFRPAGSVIGLAAMTSAPVLRFTSKKGDLMAHLKSNQNSLTALAKSGSNSRAKFAQKTVLISKSMARPTQAPLSADLSLEEGILDPLNI
jgi:hypothetical protein